MRGSKHIHGSRAKRRGYRSQRNGTPSCWANFSRSLACMATSYRTLIWLRWLWSTGLPFAPRTVILRGFAVYACLIPSCLKDKDRCGECQTAPQARPTCSPSRGRGMSVICRQRPPIAGELGSAKVISTYSRDTISTAHWPTCSRRSRTLRSELQDRCRPYEKPLHAKSEAAHAVHLLGKGAAH